MSRYRFERELLELKAIKFEAELKFLREQINPHFLFNSINNIYALSLENSPRTPEMILKLSELLRYMLYDCNHPFVALESEVKCIASIIELFQLKYPEPVDVRFEVKGDLKDNDSYRIYSHHWWKTLSSMETLEQIKRHFWILPVWHGVPISTLVSRIASRLYWSRSKAPEA
jgi:hypothetical protein